MAGIELSNLTRRFGSTVAADRVNLTVNPGELFFLLGPSGCGKTTVMRLIAGLLEPDEGSIRFDGRDVTALPTARRNTALVFQSYALWPHMTVRQNVTFGLDVRRITAQEKRTRVDSALRTIHMLDLAERRPMELSGGQQQRVALARALVVNPRVLLLDEPLSNLDAALRLEMRSEIRRLCDAAGLTTVYVTHDQEEALSIADRIAVMRDGRVEQVGSPAELYTRPVNRFVAGFLGRANFIGATVLGREEGRLVLDSAAGRLVSAVFPEAAAPGDRVTCCVRPEAVRILGRSDRTEPGGNALSARHLSTTYLGHLSEHRFEAEGGLLISAEELKPAPRRWGDTPVRLAFSPDDLVVLSD